VPAPPGSDLPPMSELDLGPFWARFDATAPAHLKLGLGATVWGLGLLLPLLLHRRSFGALSGTRQQALLQRAERARLTAPLVEVLKLVASLAYFYGDDVQRIVRGGGPS